MIHARKRSKAFFIISWRFIILNLEMSYPNSNSSKFNSSKFYFYEIFVDNSI